MALKQVSEPLPALPAQHANCQGFLDRLTAKDRAERFASAAEVSRALQFVGTRRQRGTSPPGDELVQQRQYC
jgi:hypothetical protein